MRTKYNWERFLCLRGKTPDFQDGGYLTDPVEYKAYQPDIVSFSDIADISCIVLLGEAGIGKTTVMEAMVSNNSKKTLSVNLNAYSSEDRLCRKIFESPLFKDWTKGKHELCLFLDSFDECLLRIDTIGNLLIEELGEHVEYLERLFLRIACRSSEWGSSWEEGLKKLFGKGSIEVYELAPLRRKDVKSAANQNDINTKELFQDIDRMQAVPLAINPITLNLMLSLYKKTSKLPKTQIELYREGCLQLCEENSESRQAARLIGELDGAQRMVIAERIAAVTMFSSRNAVYTGTKRDEISNKDVSVSDLCFGHETVHDKQLDINEKAIRETLGTGLFSTYGNRSTCFHRTYAEFLAARFIRNRNIPPEQIMEFISITFASKRELIPQLHGTAVWLAGMIPDVFNEILEIAPEILLRSDVHLDEKREALAGKLLKLYDEERIHSYFVYKAYWNLKHPNLTMQVRPYLSEEKRNTKVQSVAVSIVRACNLKKLQGELLDISLDSSLETVVRKLAVRALIDIGDGNTKSELKQLFKEGFDASFKSFVLEGLWPEHMTTKDMFGVLSLNKPQDFFVPDMIHFLEHLYMHKQFHKPADLIVALEWVKQAPEHCLKHQFLDIGNDIMSVAFKYLESPEDLKLFAEVFYLRENIFNEKKCDISEMGDVAKRHKIFDYVVLMILESGVNTSKLAMNPIMLITAQDIPWMIERLLNETTSQQSQYIWAFFINRAFIFGDSILSDAVLRACEQSEILHEIFKNVIGSVTFGSKKAKQQEGLWLRINKPVVTNPPLGPLLAERITGLLDEFESGNLDAWVEINYAMKFEANGTPAIHELAPNLTKYPGWKEASKATRDRIVQTAKEYIIKKESEACVTSIDSLFHSDIAAYKALVLQVEVAPGTIEKLPAKIWQKWAPVIFRYLTIPSGSEDNKLKLIKQAYQHAPVESRKAFSGIIDMVNEGESPFLSFLDGVCSCCWDEQFEMLLVNKVKNKSLKPACMASILRQLLEHNVGEAKSYAISLLAVKCTVAASLLITASDDAGWLVVWPAMQKDIEFGKRVISHILKNDWHTRYDFTCTELADLYIWLETQYPAAEAPKHELGVCYTPNFRDKVKGLKRRITECLGNEGTKEAVSELQRIDDKFPELDISKCILPKAKVALVRNSWIPLTPKDVINMGTEDVNKQLPSKCTEKPQEKSKVQHKDYESFIKNLKVSRGYNNDEVRIQVPGKEPTTYNCKNMGFRNSNTKEWKILFNDFLKEPYTCFVSKADESRRKMLPQINKKIINFLDKEFSLGIANKFKVYEYCPDMEPKTYKLILNVADGSESVISEYSHYTEEQLFEKIKQLLEDEASEEDIKAAVNAAKKKGVTNEELKNIFNSLYT